MDIGNGIVNFVFWIGYEYVEFVGGMIVLEFLEMCIVVVINESEW